MKKILAWVLLVAMVLGLFAGCGKQETPSTEPTGEVITAQDAIEYLKALYPKSEDAMKTPVNYDRMGIIRIGGIPFTVVWTTDLPEEQIKVVVSEDGATVTLDVNEKCEADTPYVLTATITDEHGNTASTTWNCVLPQAVDMVSLVKEAYALKSGESLPYEATLTGKIVSIDTVWNPEYKNITVTIAVEGAEDMPIQCYRLKGEGAENLAVGNIITVTGTLKNYNGTIEFDAGCMLDAVEQGDAVTAPTDPGEILKAAYKLKKGKALPYPVTLTGKVTSIDKPFDPAYNNISVVITVDGYSKYPILCYRLKGAGAEDIALEDTITVTGIIKNYEGTIEFDAGCQLVERISGGNTAQKPTDDEAKILKDAKKLKPGEKLPYIAILTGQVFSVDEKYSEQYKNVTVTIKVNGMRIQCYHMKGDEVQKVKVSDTITVSGQIENYNGIIEFSSPVMTDRVAGNGKLKVELGPVDESKTYYAEMVQSRLYKNLYLNGQITSSGYLKTTEDPAQSVQIHVEEVSGKGTRFYFLEGETKKYIEIHSVEISGETKQRPAIVTEPTNYWNYDSEYKVYFMSADGVYCALGTYNDFDTVSATKLTFLNKSTIGKTQFIINYLTEPSEAPVKPETPELGINYVDTPVAGTAYKFVLDQTSLGAKLGFTGQMANTYYFGTSEELDKMVDVYLEEAEGGYHIYFMKGNTKTYLNVIPRESDATKTNVVMQTKAQNAAPSVYELNTEFKYVKTACVGTDWYLGTYGSNSTISASKTSYISDTSTIGVSQFVTWFGLIGEVTPEEPEDPDTPVVPDEPETPAATTATKLNDAPMDGDMIVIYNSGKAMANVPSGNRIGAVDGTVTDDVLALTDEMAQLKVVVEGDKYIFMLGDKYLTSGATGNSMSYADTLTDCARWTLEATGDGAWYIKNVGANYNGNYNQAMEYYNGFTTYGIKTTDIYKMQMFKVDSVEEPAITTTVKLTEAPVAGDMIVIYNSGKAMANVPSGNRIGAVDGTVTDDVLALTDEMAQLKVVVEGDKYIFMLGDKYLTSGATGNSMSYADTLTDCARWTLEATGDGAWYIKNVGANYNGNYNQAMEYYNGFTTYGIKTTDIYKMQIFKVVTVQQEPEGGKLTEAPANGDYVVIYNSGKAMAGVPSGNRIGAVDATITDDVLTITDEMARLKVVVEGDKYIFMLDDKYLTSGATGNSMSYADTLTDCARWTLEATGDGAWYIKNVGANYNGNYNQAMEYYNGFTTYGIKTTDIYKMQLFKANAPANEEPETPPVNPPAGDPEGTVLTISEAIAKASAMENFAMTTTKYKVTGVIDEIVKADYGNVYIKDEAGNRLYVYGIYDITGEIRYDALNPKPVVGDTVTLLGVIGNYNGAQMKSGWLQELIPGTGTNPEQPPVNPEQPPVNPPATGDGILELTVDTMGLVSDQYKAGTVTVENIGLEYVELGNYGDGIQMRSKNGNTSALFNTVAMPGKITKIELIYTAAKATYSNADALAVSFGTAQDNLTYNTTVSTVKGQTTAYTVVPEGDFAFFKLTHNISYSCYWESIKVYYETTGTGTNPEQPPVNPEQPPVNPPPADPDGTVLTISEAIAKGSAMTGYTTTKYKVTGVIDEIVSTTYGNAYIKDEAGNRLYVYGIYDITGDIRYDALTTKPVVGDTVTLLGIIGNYEGVAQMKSGWLQELIPGATPEQPVGGGSADFDAIALPSSKPNGDSSYTATYTSAAGWVTTNSAIQCGGSKDQNPQYIVIGSDNSSKAVCMNGKTSAPGKITSPTLSGGISKLTVKFTKMFTDTELSATVTVTDKATNTTQTHVISKSLPKDEKYVVYTDEWTLDTPITGEFTIEMVNNCPTGQTGNKDRMTILSVEWEGAAPAHTHEYTSTTTATCTAAGTTTYTCACGHSYTEDVEKLGHIDENLDIDCDRTGCTAKVAPAADSTLSVFTANNLGSKLSSSYSYYVEGTIVEVLDAKNGIFLISDGVGTETFYIRLPKNTEGVLHSSWQVKLVLGDKIKVYGKINKYTTSSAPNGSYYPASQSGVVTILEQHPHTFGDPTCTEPGYCVCGQSGPAALGHADADSSGFCDRCNWNMKHAVEVVSTKYEDIKNTDQVDTVNGVATFASANFKATFTKGTAALNTNGSNHMRMNKGNILTVSATSGKKIAGLTLVAVSTSYVDELEACLRALNYTYTLDGIKATIYFDAVESFELVNADKVQRIASIEVIYEK